MKQDLNFAAVRVLSDEEPMAAGGRQLLKKLMN